jgi:type IX secretion system PorP/SprF family membrane protein
MRRLIVLCVFLLTARLACAQYFQFSQYNFTSQRISPTAPAISDYARLSFIYRNQSAAGDVKLNSNMLSASYPLVNKKTGRRWSGVGITLMDDRSGGIFAVNEGSLSYAVNVFLTQSQTITLGFKGLYQQRQLDYSGLFTEAQFVPDRGFDHFAPNGENFGTLKNNYFTFSSGLSWQQEDKDGVRTGYWSVSLFDFNKPQDAFLGMENKLNSTIVTAGGFRIYKNSNMSVFPEFLYTRSAANNVLNVGLVTRCDVKGTRNQPTYWVDVITKYVINRSAILGLQFHNEVFSLGFSYDALVNKNNVANFSAFEIGLELRKLVVKKQKPAKKTTTVAKTPAQKPPVKTPVKKTPVPAKTKTDSLTNTAKIPAKKSLTETLQHKHDSLMTTVKAGEVKHEPFVLEKVTLHFNFQFNSTELDEASTQYLDDLGEALSQDEHLRIKLTGHTDNVGSAKFNQRLSHHRANAIKEYLVSKGIDAGRIDAEGKGMAEPLNENKTEEDRAKNRRVELTIIYDE